jgi:hypothetical protein
MHARRRVRGDHVVLDTTTQAFRCGHCGATYLPKLPAPIAMFVAMAKEFTKTHRGCKPRQQQEKP